MRGDEEPRDLEYSRRCEGQARFGGAAALLMDALNE